MKKSKIVIIFTGGTIAMKIDPVTKGVVPALTSADIVSMINNIDQIADIEIFNYWNMPSPHISLDKMFELANFVKEQIERDDVDGLVVTHGTDTLEETSYLLDLYINSDKPIVVTGAMRNSSELGYDGSSNLAAAICTAAAQESIGKGVLVVLNNEVNSASEVTKTNTLSLDTFKSPEFGPLGIVDNDEVIYHRNIVDRQNISTSKIEKRIGLIKTTIGMDSEIIDFFIEKDYKGLVIEGLGRGNLPPSMLPGLERAIEKDIPVVLVSRCPTGRVLGTYGYKGGGKTLVDMGIILGGSLPGQKMRIKLMLALGKTSNLTEIKNIIEKNI